MQLTREEIVRRLKEILLDADERNAAVIERCDESTQLITELGLTSVKMLYMVIAIEEVFGMRFDDVSVGDFVTLGDVVTYIQNKCA